MLATLPKSGRAADDGEKTGPLAGLARAAERLEPRHTLGGRYFWGDRAHRRGWRIQRNVFSGEHRLLDPDDVRHARGSLEDCRKALNRLARERNIAANAERVIVLVPGLGRSSKVFGRMKREFERAGHQVAVFDYPSTVVSVPESARYLRETLASLRATRRIDVVAHSMGGIILRSLAAGNADPRIERVVMLGTPNRGADLAGYLRNWVPFRLVCGPGGCQLAPGEFVDGLPKPPGEFAVIAAGRDSRWGYNPLLRGDNDGVVTVDSVRLDGADDYAFVKTNHSWLVSKSEVLTMTLRYLDTGRLR